MCGVPILQVVAAMAALTALPLLEYEVMTQQSDQAAQLAKEVAEVVENATNRALALNYRLDDLTVTIRQSDDGWIVDYAPRELPGVIRAGGGLSIVLGRDGSIKSVEQMQ